MTVRRLAGAVLLLVVLSATVFANTAPTMEDQYARTTEDTSVLIEIRAEDADIDPTVPSGHPMRFMLLDGPTHGVLVGDLTDVKYRPEHTAYVELTYVPAEGFVGTDLITVLVIDPFDETAQGAVTIEIEVEERRAQGLLSGNWTTGFTVDVQSDGVTAFNTQITEVYRIANLTMQGTAGMRMDTIGGVKTTVFDSLRLQGSYSFGEVFVDSTINFEPEAGTTAELFDYWLLSTHFPLLDLSFAHTLYLSQTHSRSYQSLHVQGHVGPFGMSSQLRLQMNDDCVFLFDENVLSFYWTSCDDISITSTLRMACGGFESLTFNATDIPVKPIAWLPDDITLDMGLTFKLQEKSLSSSISWQPSSLGCIRMYAELVLGAYAGPAPVGGDTDMLEITIYGIALDCDLPGGITFQSATSMDPAKNSRVTGQVDYFEVMRLSGPLESCCGVPGYWNVATYWATASTMLFDWGMTVMSAQVVINDYLSLTGEATFRSGDFGDPTSEIRFGWTVRW